MLVQAVLLVVQRGGGGDGGVVEEQNYLESNSGKVDKHSFYGQAYFEDGLEKMIFILTPQEIWVWKKKKLGGGGTVSLKYFWNFF